MKFLLTSFLFFLITANLYAQDKFLADRSQTEQLSKKVTELFSQDKVPEAFGQLGVYWPLPANELDVTEEQTIRYLNLIRERFGKPIGTMKVKTETIADVARRETYLVRYQNTAIRLIFTYYKNQNGWIVNAFKWDDAFTEEFK